jgi:hypothetical protein
MLSGHQSYELQEQLRYSPSDGPQAGREVNSASAEVTAQQWLFLLFLLTTKQNKTKKPLFLCLPSLPNFMES